ncbi:M1-specific T cell receptor beta chain-like [Genypterus blacodes]|uniref:M1-specific T cell receptor beta chain-like n=1 Tax=Genypterus blacodes TaxID=154954 RepID=UPI003F75F467
MQLWTADTPWVRYYEMHWYRQLPGEEMRRMVFTLPSRKEHHFEPEFNMKKFSATKPDTDSGTFTVKNLVPEDEGLIDGSDVIQTPILWKNKGDNATMDCRHTKGATYFQMYWYRQLPGERMRQIVFTRPSKKDHDFETYFTMEKFSATKPDAHSGTFTVKNLVPEDEGLYFCAGDLKDHNYTHYRSVLIQQL